MLPHLKEEEEEGLPLVRSHFAWDEYMKVTDDMLKHVQWYELPQLLQVSGGGNRVQLHACR